MGSVLACWPAEGKKCQPALLRGMSGVHNTLPHPRKAYQVPSLHSCELNPAWGLPAHKGQERRVKEDLETRPPAERLDENSIQRAG